MFRQLSHLRPGASTTASRLRPGSTVPHLRSSSTVPLLRPGVSATTSRLGPSSTVYAVTPVNTPTNTSQYGVRNLSSLRPAEPGSNHGGKSDGGKNKPQVDIDALGKLFVPEIAIIVGLVCLNTGYAIWFNWYRERCMDAALEGPHPDSDSDDEEIVGRPDAEKLFEDVVKSRPSAYSVIVGNRGTGKSTLAANVARKTPGVLYVNVQPVRNHGDSKESRVDVLDSALRAALDWREPATPWFFAPLLQLNYGYLENDEFGRTMRDFNLAAARYKARHGSCAVLVIDNINTKNCYLRGLQGIGKHAADHLLYKIIFVTDRVTSEAMKRNSIWSRAREHRVGDLTDNEARTYLEKCKVSCDTDKLIRECGTRIVTLQSVRNKIQHGNGPDEVIKELRHLALDAFMRAGAEVGPQIAHRVALAVAKDGSVSYSRYAKLCGDFQTAKFLLQKNIFVEEDIGRVRFENIILESAIKEHMKQ